MAKDDRSPINPFTGKAHYDKVNDDKFLKDCYDEYYKIINKAKIIDDTPNGQLIYKVASNLINAVYDFLAKIGRLDYVEDYYDWEFHLLSDETVNACCIPGGKIVVFSGILSVAKTEEELAFILGHEMAHALLDHTRTRVSTQNTKNTLTTVSYFGSFAFDLIGLGEVGSLTRAAVNTASIGSQYLLLNPWGRKHELEADYLGMLIIHWAGYDIRGVPAFWQKMSGENANNFDFFSTHPADDKRIAVMKSLVLKIEKGIDYSKPVLAEAPDAKGSSQIENDAEKICKSCGCASNEDAIFCTNCGQKFEDSGADNAFQVESSSVKVCPGCGHAVAEDSVFCTNCGRKFEDSNVSENVCQEVNGVEDAPQAEVDSMKVCPSCGHEVVDDVVFCTNCGKMIDDFGAEKTADTQDSVVDVEEVSARKVCHSCGQELNEDALFCTNCGAKFESSDAAEDNLVEEADAADSGAGETIDAMYAEGPGSGETIDSMYAVDDKGEDEVEDAPEAEVPARKVCHSCGQELNDDALFCTNCGTKFEDSEAEVSAGKVCHSCGQELNDDALFCTNCGTKFEDSEVEVSAGKVCHSCGQELNDDALFCTNCGAKFETQLICPNCGVNVDKGDKICTSCGFKLIEDEELKCPSCGSVVNGDEIFCNTCGNKIR